MIIVQIFSMFFVLRDKMTRTERKISNALQFFSSFSIVVFFAYLITYLSLHSVEISGTPTVQPYKKFDLDKDVDKLFEVAKKVPNRAPDGNTMVRMVCHRSREQRLKMKDKFQEKHQQDIVTYCGGAADGEISLGDLLDDLFRPVLEVYTCHLHWELTDIFKTTDKNSLVEILLSIPPQEKQKFLSAYNDTFRCPVPKQIEEKIQDTEIAQLLQTMVNITRLPDITPDKIDWELAKKEATILNEGRKEWNKKHEELDRILLQTPILQLNATFEEFRKINGKEIGEVMKKKINRNLRECYKAMVLFAKDKHMYYARRLEKAMKGCGTQDHVLNRIVGIRCEDDLKEIATLYQLNTADSLIDALAADTTMHHEMMLTCLAGKHTAKET